MSTKIKVKYHLKNFGYAIIEKFWYSRGEILGEKLEGKIRGLWDLGNRIVKNC